MTKVNNFQQKFTFEIEFHYRYTAYGEQEKDFDNVEITDTSAEKAIEQVMERFHTPSRRIFEIKVVQQKNTITADDMFFLTAPTVAFNF